MGLKCYICHTYDSKRQSLYRIPHRNEKNAQNVERWRLWLKIVEGKQEDLDKIRICSNHFLEKRPAQKDDYLNIDWVPSQNLGRFSKNKNVHHYFLKNRNGNTLWQLHNSQFVDDNANPLVNPKDNLNLAVAVDDGQGGRRFSWNENNLKPEKSLNLAVSVDDGQGGQSSSWNENNLNREKSLNLEVAVGDGQGGQIYNRWNANNLNTMNSFDLAVDGQSYVWNENNLNPKNNLNLSVAVGDDKNSKYRENETHLIQKNVVVTSGQGRTENLNPSYTHNMAVTNHYADVSDDNAENSYNAGTLQNSTQNKNSTVAYRHPSSSVDGNWQINPTNISSFVVDGELNQNVIGNLPRNEIVLPPVKKRKIENIESRFFFPMGVQTDLTAADIELLFRHYQEVVEDRKNLLLRISTLVIDVDFFKNNDKRTLFYTGFPTWKLLDHFFMWIEPFLPEHGNAKLSPFQMLVLTLMKLRLNLLFTDLAYRFEINVTTASRHFHRVIYILYKKFYDTKLIHWPEDQILLTNTPSYFRSHLREAVTVVIDCFELFIERSSVLRAQSQSWSQYKHHNTIKFLIGISMSGAIIFISPAFGGRTSDKEITARSGILKKLKANNLVLADKGFLIEDEVKARDASLRIPAFVRNGSQLSPTDVEVTRETANLRIHVERLISVVRQKFNICSDLAPMSAISKKNDLYNNDLYDKIVYICCCLVNLCPSTIPNNFEM